MSMKSIQGPVVFAEHILWDGTAAYNMDVSDYKYAIFQTVGTGSVTWEATIDGTNWVSVLGTDVTDASTAVTETAAGIYRMQCTGFAYIRAGTPSGFDEIRGRATAN